MKLTLQIMTLLLVGVTSLQIILALGTVVVFLKLLFNKLSATTRQVAGEKPSEASRKQNDNSFLL